MRILEHWEEESKLDERIARQVAGKKRRRQLKMDREDELTFAVEYCEAPPVARNAITDKNCNDLWVQQLYGKYQIFTRDKCNKNSL